MKSNNRKGILLSVLFILMSYFFTRGLYSPFFVLLIALLLLVAFFKERMRSFAWMVISFFLGNLLLVYMDTFMESFHFPHYSLVMFSQMLLLIPILLISYVIKKFKQEIIFYFQKPILTGKIQLPFNIAFSLSKFFLILCLLSILSIIGTLFVKNEDMRLSAVLFILLFASINALLEEVLWRGIFLPKLIAISNHQLGLVVTSIAFGLHTTMFGFSLIISISYMFLGILLGILTIKFKSIFPSVVVHFSVTTLLLISGWMVIPIIN
ncbi:CPBP family intramembrane glutamic endopeptidase [Neobacillus drentensis]|uniref:CPBP family intramembrane glutamic endopeptidase n=1 Tax=Neobacillus drentensis TaxID=220684 RepID=UPI0008243B52|nr:CPBP family intramembrane glutamic endopeptidase [Neobacillus drentensis]